MKNLFFAVCLFSLSPIVAFASQDTVSRSEFVSAAVRTLVGEIESSALQNRLRFRDVDESGPMAQNIQYAFENGVLSMPPDGRFFPERPITRAEAIKVLIALLDRNTTDTLGQSRFLDVKENIWSSPYIRTAEELCLLSSDRIVFLPDFLLTPQTAAEWTTAAFQVQENGSACPESFELPPPPPQVDELPEISVNSTAIVRPTPGFVTPGSIPRNAGNVPFLSLTITAPSTEAVTVELIRITRKGLGDRDDFAAVKVMQDGIVKGNSRAFSADQIAELNLAFDPVRIAAGESATIVIAADLDAAEGGGEHELVIAEPEDIVIIGADSGEAVPVSGSFPFGSKPVDSANIQTAELAVEFEPVRNTLRYGRKRAEIARIRISETLGDNAAQINAMRLSFDGIDDEGLKNLFVELNGNIVSPVLEETVDRQALFSFPDGAITIDRGDDIRLIVHADIYVIDEDFRVFFDDLASDLQTASPLR